MSFAERTFTRHDGTEVKVEWVEIPGNAVLKYTRTRQGDGEWGRPVSADNGDTELVRPTHAVE